ncbi:MAG: hypothetical protein ACI3VQ_00225 [Faecousia sp.]
MARSERITQATERFTQAVVNKEDRADAMTWLTQVISDEIVKSFSPFNNIEIPFIIVALRAIERSMRQRFPMEENIAAQLEKNYSVISMIVPSGRKEE